MAKLLVLHDPIDTSRVDALPTVIINTVLQNSMQPIIEVASYSIYETCMHYWSLIIVDLGKLQG